MDYQGKLMWHITAQQVSQQYPHPQPFQVTNPKYTTIPPTPTPINLIVTTHFLCGNTFQQKFFLFLFKSELHLKQAKFPNKQTLPRESLDIILLFIK